MPRITGREIAIRGYQNEQDVCDKFNNWKNDVDAQEWLKLMYYDLSEIDYVHAEKIGMKGYKSDVNVTINITISKRNLICVENIQVKLVSTDHGFNQVDKRKVDKYISNWHIDESVANLLKYYDGELLPYKSNTRSVKRMFADEFTEEERKNLIDFFQNNLIMIISDVIRGRGRFAAEWTLVINKSDGYRWKLMAINEAINIYAGDLKAEITPKGNFRLGNITLQRKGGDSGRDSANMLQFKANPMLLFNKFD